MAEKTTFDILNSVNVNEHTETKDTGKTKLTYLSWAWAWAEVKKRFPAASYEIIKFNGLPYVFDEKTGFMVYTTVTIDGITHEMWLPVMDGNNRAMLDHSYEVQTQYKKFTVQPATMFDINKTIMRCLTKNLAMFGLGLYIYAGEDLPETPEEEKVTQPKAKEQQTAPKASSGDDARARLRAFIKENNLDPREIAIDCNLTKDSSDEDFRGALVYAMTLVGGNS